MGITSFEDDYGFTHRQRAMQKLMTRQQRIACDSVLERKRFDTEEEFRRFVNAHEFVTDIISYGHGCYEVEYFA